MKCSKCNSEWNTSPSISASMTVCPFCGESLCVKKDAFVSDYDVLRYLCSHFGIDFMRDGARVLACFADLAPMLKKEKRILSYFIECNGHIQILDSIAKDLAEQQLATKRVVRQMTDELFVAETVSCAIAESFLKAVNNPTSNPAVTQRKEEKAASTTPPVSQKPSTLDLSNCEEFQISGHTVVKYLGNEPVVVIPDGVRIIGKKAFADNTSIKEVRLPDSVQKIKESAFDFCTGLYSVNLPAGLTELGNYAFSNSSIRGSIAIPENLSIFGEAVFNNTELEKVIIPGSVKVVPDRTFTGCNSLTEVVIEQGVAKLGKEAFDDCPNLKTITLPDTLETIEKGLRPHIFCGTKGIQSVVASEQWKADHLPYYREMIPAKDEKGNYLIKDNVLVRYYGRAVRPAIPNGIRSIGPHAFYNNPHILGISIPDGVLQISENAFSCCTNLRSLVLPRTLTRIGQFAFSHTGISLLNIPNGVYGIGSGAFEQCKQLCDISFPDSLLTVTSNAFFGCNNIKTIRASAQWKQKNSELISRLTTKPTTVVVELT